MVLWPDTRAWTHSKNARSVLRGRAWSAKAAAWHLAHSTHEYCAGEEGSRAAPVGRSGSAHRQVLKVDEPLRLGGEFSAHRVQGVTMQPTSFDNSRDECPTSLVKVLARLSEESTRTGQCLPSLCQHRPEVTTLVLKLRRRV